MSSLTEVSLTKAYWTAASINSTGANLASGNTTDVVGNVAGYNYVANQAASTGQQITVNTTHGWNIVGTGGTTTYGFGKGDGNDVILHSGSDDTVLLYNVSLNDVKSAAVQSSANAFVINLTDGSSLTLKGYSADSAKTFTLGDGTSWTYSYSTKGWTKA